MSEIIKKAVCPYDCPTTCGFKAVIEDGKLKKLFRTKAIRRLPVSCAEK